MKKAQKTRLADYTPPAFLIDHVDLDFDIQDTQTRVRSRLRVRRNPKSKDKKAPLILNGKAQKLLSIKRDGKNLNALDYKLTENDLTLSNVPDAFVLEVESTNEPLKNTALSGLYAAGPMLCTQCEAEGFRRITYYPDRPDVLAKFTVTIHADKKRYPVLLSNGNLVAKGNEGKSRHWTKWEDPFPKPCYLFALVAGKLDKVTDHFITKSKRKILIEIYVEPGKKKETGFALAALKKAMKWDEDTYGLEYDLDRFMLVAVSYFNMGAMENKGLNIFNDACVLGRAETATDGTIAFIERVVGHEYFHNWTGDRITCRDWFQLSLKEGLTVFREQEFCGDMNSRAVERLTNVASLRRAQFAEDAGAMAHPVRPASYQTIYNFYTATVYSKGAEVVRMIQTLVGRQGFRKGVNLYVKSHDGQAATCDDFVKAMADANRIDLDQFMLWYSQAGTPVLDVTGAYNAKRKEYRLHVKQSCPPTPGQPNKEPMHLPLAVGLLDAKGRDLIGTKVLALRKAQEEFVFKNVRTKPHPSLLRDFSAPVRLNVRNTDADLLFLMSHDSDAFNRWEAAQKLFTKYALADTPPPRAFLSALRSVLRDRRMDDATKAMTLTLPSEAELGLALKAQNKLIDPIALYEARQNVIRALASSLEDDLWKVFEKIDATLDEQASDGVSRGRRSLKNLCATYLAKVVEDDMAPLAAMMVARSRNMTDKIAGLSLLADSDSPLRADMLAVFEKKFHAQPTIMDHWLSVQAAARRPHVLKDVRRLMKHPSFALNNPNRVSALIGVFAANPLGFHAADGSGYRFVTEILAKQDRLNPEAAARLAKTFLRWRDFEPKRQALMKAKLKKLSALKGLSVNCREVVRTALAG
jgi:aminopeptidase N